MKEVLDIVLNFEKVQSHLKVYPQDEKKVSAFIKEIQGDYNTKVLGAMEKLIDVSFKKLYDGVQLQSPEGFSLKETIESYHVILVPNHQSHADYMALQYIFYKFFQVPVYIAAGKNMNIFPIGEIFKKCGAFFLRRKFDDKLYKAVFQGYINYLLQTDKVVEFFFEGGRTRTGKLLPPRYGLFSMILEAHGQFREKKPLMFIPVSIAHEQIPEERAHAKELGGAKKEQESTRQLLKLFGLFNKKLGTIHVRLGNGIVVNNYTDLKLKTREVAFECFKRVGKGMPITPSSLLSLILLDEPSGALTWQQIEQSAKDIIKYCQYMNIPLTQSLEDNLENSIKLAMDIFLNNKKVELIKRKKINKVFYSVKDDSRVYLLFHKNMILHHFFVPTLINYAWINIFNGRLGDKEDLISYLKQKRIELKYEFYLPSVRELLIESRKIIEYATDKKIENLDEVLSFDVSSMYKLAKVVSPFSTSLNYIYEGYYLGTITLIFLEKKEFDYEEYLKVAQELFEIEIDHGRVISYRESFTVPKLQAVFDYFVKQREIMKKVGEKYKVINLTKLLNLREKFSSDISNQVSIKLKINNEKS